MDERDLSGSSLGGEEVWAPEPLEEEDALWSPFGQPFDPETLAHVAHYAVNVIEMAASGVIGTYAFNAYDKRVRRIFRRGREAAPPTNPLRVREAARWAINSVYSDILPTQLDPKTEVLGPVGWMCAFDYQGHRYTAWKQYDQGSSVDVIVQRDQL